MTINATWIDEYEVEDEPWLIEGFISPTLTVISGQPKHGKTLLARHLAISLITGEPLAEREVSSGPHLVAWMGYDAGWKQELKTNLGARAQGKIILLDAVRDQNKKKWEEVLSFLKEQGVSILVIDHLYGLAGSLTLNDAENVSIVMDLIRPIYDSGIAVILLAQAGRSEYGKGRVSHSVSIEAEARALVRISGRAGGNKRNIELISNTRGDETLSVTITPDEFTSSEKVKRETTTSRVSPNQVREFLENALPEELTNWSAAGRGLVRLGHSVNEDAGRQQTSRWREQGLIKIVDGRIVAGDSLLPVTDLYSEINVASDYLPTG